VEGEVPVDSETLLVIDFVNLKIKPAQSFEGTHRGMMCIRVLIGVNAHTYMSICVCTVFLKKKKQKQSDKFSYWLNMFKMSCSIMCSKIKQILTYCALYINY
jgi:hypothetical protein